MSGENREELLVKIERMKHAQKAKPGRLRIKQVFALIVLGIQVLLVFSTGGSEYKYIVFIYVLPVFLVAVDYFIVVGRLRLIEEGKA